MMARSIFPARQAFVAVLALFALVSCATLAKVSASVAEAETKPLVPDLELPPQRKEVAASTTTSDTPAPSSTEASKKKSSTSSTAGKGFGGPRRSPRRKKDDFDYFLFVRQWDPAVCSSMSCRIFPKQQNFTIHGLWPEREDGSWPQYCYDDRFDTDSLDALLPRLREQWPSFGAGSDPAFWKHEWLRHGTCSGRGNGTTGEKKKSPMALGKDEETFFSAVLDLHDKYQLLPALVKAGIVPDDDKAYSREDVVEALRADESATGGTRAAVHCGSGRKGGGELTEVWLCLKRETLEPFDCPDNVLQRRVGKNGDTDTKKGGCETLKLPKLKTRSTAPKNNNNKSNSNKNNNKSNSNNNKPAPAAGAATKSGFGSAGDAAVTLEKSL